jgi:hypothetical protein
VQAHHVSSRIEVGKVTAALLAMTIVLAAVSATLFLVSFRRRDPLPAFAGMTLMIVAAIPAAAYASVSG